MQPQPGQTGLPSVPGQRRRRNTFATPLSDMRMIFAALSERAAAESKKCCAMTPRRERTNPASVLARTTTWYNPLFGLQFHWWRLLHDAASLSKNANQMMQMIPDETGGTLPDQFDANLCGRDLRQGKPHPEIFLLAAAALGVAPVSCVVVEDAPSGIEAAKAGGMMALGVARLGDEALLQRAGADLVVTNLDEVAVDALPKGHLYRR